MLLSLLLACSAASQQLNTDPFLRNHAQHSDDCHIVEGELVCFQKRRSKGSIRVGCVGDSITAVGHTSSTAHHWPNQLQDMLDEKHGNGTYSVTNLGVCGSTLQKEAHEPWWNTAAYKTLVANKWDVIFVMLGTNDAAPTAQGYWPASNHANCDEATAATLSSCNFAKEFRELLQVIKSVGPNAASRPEVHVMIPPPLMENGAYNMNQTIINTIFPQLIPLIAKANADIVDSVIDVYSGMGGIPAPKWKTEMPLKCLLNSTWPPCAWYCDNQSCRPGQCHPNDVGCKKLAQVVYDGWLGGSDSVQQAAPAAIWSGANNYYGTSQSQVGPKFDEPLAWPAKMSQPPANVCPGGNCSSQCGAVAPVALSDRIIGVWRSNLHSSFAVYAVSYDKGQILWQTEFNYTTQSSEGVPNSIAVSENGVIALVYTKDFSRDGPLPNRNVTFALVNSDNGKVIHTETFAKQSGFSVPIAGPIVDPSRGNVFYFASGGFFERYDNGSRVVLWDGTYGFSRPDFALQPGPDNIVVAVGAVGSGYGGTLQTTTTDQGAAAWHVFDNPQYSYSASSFTNPSFTALYYNVATSAVGSFKGSMVSRDMKSGNERWAWSSPDMRSVTMVNGGVRFVNATTMTTTGAGGAGQVQVQEQVQFAPLVVWKTSTGNYTLTMIDDVTGNSVWQFQTQWEKCRWPLSLLTTGKGAGSSLVDTKIIFTCQGSSSPVVSHVLDPTTGRELSAESAKLVPYNTNVICYKWSAGRNTVFRYGTNGEIVYARVD